MFLYQQVQTLESERDEMLDSISKMEIKIQTLNATASKMEEQETELNSLRNESKKLQRSNTHLQRKVDEVVNQNNSLESENQKLEKTIENLRNESRSIDTLQKELKTSELNNQKLEIELHIINMNFFLCQKVFHFLYWFKHTNPTESLKSPVISHTT